MKYLKYISIGVLFLLTLLFCGGYYLLGVALMPEELETRSRDPEASLNHICREYPELKPWTDSLFHAGALREMYLENDEGVTLHAYYIAAARPTAKTAVIVHGYTDNAIRMLPIGYLYNRQLGYNILLPDLYAHGASQGEAIRMGWKDRLDVLQWTAAAEELFQRHNKEVAAQAECAVSAKDTDSIASALTNIRMVVHGISMGAATTMMAAGEVGHGIHQQPFIKCFVEDCGYTSAWDEFRGELKNRFSLPAFPLLHTASLLCDWEYGWNFREASALEQVRKCRLPMLFIHGDADDFVPTEMVYPLFEAKPEPKELWVVPGVDHAHSYRDAKEEYTRRVEQFVGKYIQ